MGLPDLMPCMHSCSEPQLGGRLLPKKVRKTFREDRMQRSAVQLRLGIVLYQNTRRQLERLTRSLALNRASSRCPSFDVVFKDN